MIGQQQQVPSSSLAIPTSKPKQQQQVPSSSLAIPTSKLQPQQQQQVQS